MAIKNINLAMAGSYGAYSQKLTQATKQELEQLGIPFNQNTTEKEGKSLISEYRTKNKENAQQEGFISAGKPTESELLKKAKTLAKKVGVEFPEQIELNQLLILIQEKLEEKIASCKNNPEKLQELKVLSQELSSIQAQSNGSMGYDSSNQALLKSLELLGQYNKNFLNK